MSFTHPLRAFSVGAQSTTQLAEKTADDPAANTKTHQSTVTCVYQIHISGYWCNVTVLWCKNLMNHSLNLVFSNPESGQIFYTCKIDLKPWLFWSKRGCKSSDIEGCQIDIYWDLRSARLSSSPEPYADYYVAIVSDGEVVLLLGDLKKKAYKKTKSRPALMDPVLFYKKENVFAKKSFSTRAKFDEKKQEHDIAVESSTTGPKDPEMWISIDGIIVIHVKNLQWKFRGNQTVMVNNLHVQVFWDVHDWLFNAPGTGQGLFIFKPRPADSDDDRDNNSTHDTNSDTSDGSKYFSTKSNAPTPEFSLFLYACKIE